MADKLLEYIVRTAEKLRKDMEAVLPQLGSDIDAIISENEKDIKKIETLLDILLDYRQMGLGEAEFRRLKHILCII